MIPLTLSEIATATSGKLINACDAQLIIKSVSTDTRNIERGALFVALQGVSFDAHQFLVQAEKTGAKALIVHQQTDSTLPTILVKDTRIALGQL
ncbi:MAG: UDP-N-acetylmuramoylalanyl-D-glutamyl-2, 6-diaminopimelate--D-alanyl-D-alanine ligase, partial [Psychromonas sp.]|nr:UDP-N-acetylmuramoylalanyl-D-glutamyl-2, 6-diaminopimelate--D-alanyl-D-alanine ligase [Psychromonas sp.]